MADTETNSETVTPQAPSNETGNTPAPTGQPSADVEQAKREAEQARMRANQLENELKKIQEEQEAARQKQLEEKEEFKTLYEQTQSRLREIENAQAEADRQATLTAATTEVFKEYPEAVVELAKTAGLGLSDDSDAAKASLKEKLDAFKAKVGGSAPTVNPNNPAAPAPTEINRQELVRREYPGAPSPMAEASARGDLKPQYDYIKSLPAIERMKEIARNGN